LRDIKSLQNWPEAGADALDRRVNRLYKSPNPHYDKNTLQHRGIAATWGGETVAKKLSSKLYKAARVLNDIETVASGDPKKITRRAKNKLLGRLLRKIW